MPHLRSKQSTNQLNKMQEDFLFKQGYLNVKRGLISFKRHVTLAAPTSMNHVQKVFETCFIADPYAPIQNRAIPWLGNISFAAVKKVPLLIIASNETYEDPVFIPLDQTLWLKEEEDMERPCCFEINIENQALVFSCNTSTAYQQWIGALHNAVGIAKAAHIGVPTAAANTSQWLESLPTGANGVHPLQNAEIASNH